MSHAPPVPEREIVMALRVGVAALHDELVGVNPPAPNRSQLAQVLRGQDLDDDRAISDDELAKIRALWASNPPSVVQGFARENSPFPLFAVTLGRDVPVQDYIGQSISDAIAEAEITGQPARFGRRVGGAFNVYVYAQHPDTVVWNYRIARHILSVATPRLIRAGLQEPQLSGADLMPEPKYTPDNLYVRRLSVEVEYNEAWSDQTSLWAALNGSPVSRMSASTTVNVRHVDSEAYPGTVTPYDQEAE